MSGQREGTVTGSKRVLVTFLGKGQRPAPKPGQPPALRGYQPAVYDFGDGVRRATRVFGIALFRYLEAFSGRPDRLVVVGTSGSDWDLLYDELDLLAPGDSGAEAAIDEAIALAEAAQVDGVAAEHVAPLARRLEAVLGVGIGCVIIPYGRTRAEQIVTLARIVAGVAPGDRVVLDVTHGLRHLPVLGLVTAVYLKAAARATVDAVYYGAFDLRVEGNVAPVIRLDVLLETIEWIQALNTYDKDGDYAVFAPLLAGALPDRALAALRQGAFLERTARAGAAARALAEFRTLAGDLSRLEGPAALFADSIAERMAWIDQADHYGRQRQLALLSLAAGDLWRATTLGWEAAVTRIAQDAGVSARERRSREGARVAYEERGERALHSPGETPQRLVAEYDAYRALRSLRNAIVHDDRDPHPATKRLLRSESDTAAALAHWFRLLLPLRK